MRSDDGQPIAPSCIARLADAGGRIAPLAPIGAEVHGIDLSAETPPEPELRAALELTMARRGFLVFRDQGTLANEAFLRASCWWGGRALHSTHGVHPATPGGDRHIFRLSNDERHGIPGVGPQWHNDGSFEAATFSHAGYHIIRPAERGGGTLFAHQGAAHDALPDDRRTYWRRLSSVNSTSGVVHPLVHEHPLTHRACVWLHLGMTGAVIERHADREEFRLLEADELRQLCHEYDDLLNAGLKAGYACLFEYRAGDCVFVDNLAVAHKAAPEAHRPASEQGLRIMHRSTVRGVAPLAPRDGLPQYVDIHGPNPIGTGVWQGGGIGFRWEDGIPMQN
ncbi:MAG: TauD/TfdA family dioxygenase [Pseudomonadales bacterium]|jgi:taurine dioxygenase|nr:TauD/TfdA family dioxygenase [Pseudomonadales bacterium]